MSDHAHEPSADTTADSDKENVISNGGGGLTGGGKDKVIAVGAGNLTDGGKDKVIAVGAGNLTDGGKDQVIAVGTGVLAAVTLFVITGRSRARQQTGPHGGGPGFGLCDVFRGPRFEQPREQIVPRANQPRTITGDFDTLDRSNWSTVLAST